jgi:hypothetical protein
MGPEHQDIQGLTFFVSKERGGDLERLTEFIESGKLTPSIDKIFSGNRCRKPCAASQPVKHEGRSPSPSEQTLGPV